MSAPAMQLNAAPAGFEFNEMEFSADGSLTIYAGTTNHGQGHHTLYTQVACEYLGLSPDDIYVIEGDTGEVKKMGSAPALKGVRPRQFSGLSGGGRANRKGQNPCSPSSGKSGSV